jgi:hypothetical protein
MLNELVAVRCKTGRLLRSISSRKVSTLTFPTGVQEGPKTLLASSQEVPSVLAAIISVPETCKNEAFAPTSSSPRVTRSASDWSRVECDPLRIAITTGRQSFTKRIFPPVEVHLTTEEIQNHGRSC